MKPGDMREHLVAFVLVINSYICYMTYNLLTKHVVTNATSTLFLEKTCRVRGLFGKHCQTEVSLGQYQRNG